MSINQDYDVEDVIARWTEFDTKIKEHNLKVEFKTANEPNSIKRTNTINVNNGVLTVFAFGRDHSSKPSEKKITTIMLRPDYRFGDLMRGVPPQSHKNYYVSSFDSDGKFNSTKQIKRIHEGTSSYSSRYSGQEYEDTRMSFTDETNFDFHYFKNENNNYLYISKTNPEPEKTGGGAVAPSAPQLPADGASQDSGGGSTSSPQQFNPDDYYEILIKPETQLEKGQFVMREEDIKRETTKVYYTITDIKEERMNMQESATNVHLSPVITGVGNNNRFNKNDAHGGYYFLLVLKKEMDIDKYEYFEDTAKHKDYLEKGDFIMRDDVLYEMTDYVDKYESTSAFLESFVRVKPKKFILDPTNEINVSSIRKEELVKKCVWKDMSEEGSENLLFRRSVIKKIPTKRDSELRYYTIIVKVFAFATEPRDINGFKVRDNKGTEITLYIEDLKNEDNGFQIQEKVGTMPERTPAYIQSLREIRITSNNLKNLRKGDRIKHKFYRVTDKLLFKSEKSEEIYTFDEYRVQIDTIYLGLNNSTYMVESNTFVEDENYLFQPTEEEKEEETRVKDAEEEKKRISKEKKEARSKRIEDAKNTVMNAFTDPNEIKKNDEIKSNDIIDHIPIFGSKKTYKITDVHIGEMNNPNDRYTIQNMDDSNDIKTISKEEITNGKYYRHVTPINPTSNNRSLFGNKSSIMPSAESNDFHRITPSEGGVSTDEITFEENNSDPNNKYKVLPVNSNGNVTQLEEPSLWDRIARRTRKVKPETQQIAGRKKTRRHKQHKTKRRKQNRRITKGKRRK